MVTEVHKRVVNSGISGGCPADHNQIELEIIITFNTPFGMGI